MTQFPLSNNLEYQVQQNLNLYDSPECDRLATQAAVGRHLRIVERSLLQDNLKAVKARLCEDDYPGWLALSDAKYLNPVEMPYRAKVVLEVEIREKIPEAIAFTHHAMNQPNHYLWGGTVGPDYDCSGLMQAAFASVGIWLPRDAYQQEAFTQAIALELLQPGDLIFFGSPQKATHVGLYLGSDRYIHSSGKEQGRNGIGIDILSEDGDRISQAYYQQLRGAGRVMASYQPTLGQP